MKKNIICIALCGVLSVACIAGGFFLLGARNDKQKSNDEVLQKLQDEKSGISSAALEQEADALDQENQQLQERITEAEENCTQLDGEAERLQQEYDVLIKDETNVYYMTILEALQEGMSKVEEYISGSK